MTTLAPPPTPVRARPHAHRSHRHRPLLLPRPARAETWDPLRVDAEGSPPAEGYPLPPVRDASPPTEVADLATVASVLTKAVAEVLLGLRPPGQVQSWLLDEVWQIVRRRAHLGRRTAATSPPVPVRILRVHPCQLSERACELSVVLHDGRRVRAAALRLTLHRGRWRAAAIRIG